MFTKIQVIIFIFSIFFTYFIKNELNDIKFEKKIYFKTEKIEDYREIYNFIKKNKILIVKITKHGKQYTLTEFQY
jgi:hypothetical protein